MKTEEINEGWIENYKLGNIEEVHPSHAIHVTETNAILQLIEDWKLNHPEISDSIDDLKRIIIGLKKTI